MTEETLDIIEPPKIELTLAGKTFVVTPIVVKELPAFSRAVEPILVPFFEGDAWGALLLNQERLIEATAIGARVDPEWLGEQQMDVLAALMRAVCQVNADFFARAVFPQLAGALKAINAASGQSHGQTSSPDSSPEVTAEAM